MASLRSLFTSILPEDRILDDALSLTAVATDASFYRIHPKIILDVLSVDEMIRVFEVCSREKLPMTFRAAGTSLSGQALGEGALIRISRGWRGLTVLDGGARIALEPGVIGATANRALKKYQRKIGPDPATIQNCMIGGIAANNSSGMCCGVDQNTYRTMDSVKLILSLKQGPVNLDTGDLQSREAFRVKHGDVLDALKALRDEVFSKPELLERIQRKYKIKNTLGYSLNALVDFEDPIEMLSYLMIGSEGTLGFISEITYRTVEDFPHRACALLFFETLSDACLAATAFRTAPIVAAELMDRTSLRKVENQPGMPAVLKTLPEMAAALLIETRASDAEGVSKQIEVLDPLCSGLKGVRAFEFSTDPKVYETWWNIRRGLFPSVGRGRPAGTTVIIEDVAFPIEVLAPATEDLVQLLHRHGYPDAILFGHARDGNLHFSFAQDFNSKSEIDRYAALMAELGTLVAVKWKGSLKAEHGTGRNMAPFVELEWGSEAYSLMTRIKAILDPNQVLNPGVILNRSSTVHLEALKTIPVVDPLIDECIECGFCEVHCPSRDLTVTPRQRIAAFRELARHPRRAQAYESLMKYPVQETCAADGLCATACPVSIDTGSMIKKYRARKRRVHGVSQWMAHSLTWVLRFARLGLRFLSLMTKAVPRAASFRAISTIRSDRKMVYLPSCISRTLGAAQGSQDTRSLPTVMQSLFQKSSIEVIYPARLESLCCGLPFESKGFPQDGEFKVRELEAALLKASENGKYPIVSDTSPCTHHLKKRLDPRLKVIDSVEFLHQLILKRDLIPRQTHESIAIHTTCSTTEMGLTSALIDVARACSSQVVVPNEVNCCGFAGDKGFTHPELTRSALKALAPQVKECGSGFSNSRTCEIGLSREGKIPYQSIAYLVDRLTSTNP